VVATFSSVYHFQGFGADGIPLVQNARLEHGSHKVVRGPEGKDLYIIHARVSRVGSALKTRQKGRKKVLHAGRPSLILSSSRDGISSLNFEQGVRGK